MPATTEITRIGVVSALLVAAYLTYTCPCESLNACKRATYFSLLGVAAVGPLLV